MRILLSAYACEPGKGSEEGVGWSWVTGLLERGHDVWVLTRASHAEAIEKELATWPADKARPHFIFFDVPYHLRWAFWKKFWPFKAGLFLYWHLWNYPQHFFWQRLAARQLLATHEQVHFDVVHHVTFATLRRTSFVGELGAPFILGPVGGGDTVPWRLRWHFGLRNWLYELALDISVLLAKYNPGLWRTFDQASVIYVTGARTLKLIPTRQRHKAHFRLQLGIEPGKVRARDSLLPKTDGPVKFLYVGRFIHWKGMYLGLRAFAAARSRTKAITLTIVGDGQEKVRWQMLATQLGLDDCVTWLPWQDHTKLSQTYQSHDVFLFPSLRDSGGAVVLEALQNGLAVLCLNLGGPSVSVNDSCGIRVAAEGCSADDVVERLAGSIVELSEDSALRERLRHGALARAEEYLWPHIVSAVYEPMETMHRTKGE